MEANRSRVRWTWAEYARLPESGSTRYEVIDDELVVTPAPTPHHQRILTRILVLLHQFLEEHDLGEVFPAPVDVLFAEGDYFEPDLVLVAKSRQHLYSDRGIEGPPDLVIEILSPSTLARDRGIKLDRYRLFGVPQYWIVDPEGRQIEVWDLAGGATVPAVYSEREVLEWSPAGTERSLEIPVSRIVA